MISVAAPPVAGSHTKSAAAGPPKPVVLMEAIRAALKSVALIHSGACQRSHSQCARPMWSGCMWVTMTRRIGRPSSWVSKIRCHWALDSSRVMQQSTTVQPVRPSISSRNSHRLMWSSAKGRAMRIQRAAGASPVLSPRTTSMVLPGAGMASPNG